MALYKKFLQDLIYKNYFEELVKEKKVLVIYKKNETVYLKGCSDLPEFKIVLTKFFKLKKEKLLFKDKEYSFENRDTFLKLSFILSKNFNFALTYIQIKNRVYFFPKEVQNFLDRITPNIEKIAIQANRINAEYYKITHILHKKNRRRYER